jgi:hypothetical protein
VPLMVVTRVAEFATRSARAQLVVAQLSLPSWSRAERRCGEIYDHATAVAAAATTGAGAPGALIAAPRGCRLPTPQFRHASAMLAASRCVLACSKSKREQEFFSL